MAILFKRLWQRLLAARLLASLDSSVISLALDATFPFREGFGKGINLSAPPEPSLKGKVPNEVRRKS